MKQGMSNTICSRCGTQCCGRSKCSKCDGTLVSENVTEKLLMAWCSQCKFVAVNSVSKTHCKKCKYSSPPTEFKEG